MRLKLELKKIIPAAVMATVITATTVSAASGVTISSKGIIAVDGTDISIDSADFGKLNKGLVAAETSVENYDKTSGSIYTNINTIDSSISKAKADLADKLAAQGINVYQEGSTWKAKAQNSATSLSSRTDKATVLSSSGVTMKQLISFMGTSVQDSTSTAVATASYYASPNGSSLAVKDSDSGKAVALTTSAGKSITALDATNNKATFKLAGVSALNLGANESITLPKGYYSTPLTVYNSVKSGGEFKNFTRIYKANGPKTSTTITKDYSLIVAVGADDSTNKYVNYSGQGTIIGGTAEDSSGVSVAVYIIANVKAGDTIRAGWFGQVFAME